MNKKQKRQYLIDCCFGRKIHVQPDLLAESAKYVGINKDQLAGDTHCRYCKTPMSEEDAVVTYGYWSPTHLMSLCHSWCKQNGEAEEAYECQKIDKACNDCANYRRSDSTCMLDGRHTQATPNNAAKSTLHDTCFVHRKDRPPQSHTP